MLYLFSSLLKKPIFIVNVGFFVFLMITPVTVIGQSGIDSLISTLNQTKKDTQKINTLYKISENYYKLNDISNAIKYVKLGLQLSKNNNDYKTAEFLNRLGSCYYKQGNYQISLNYYLQAVKNFEELKNNNEVEKNLNNISLIFIKLYDYDNALKYNYQAEKKIIPINSNDSTELAKIFQTRGAIFSLQNKFNQAREYNKKALLIFKRMQQNNNISAILSAIGNVFYKENNLDSALIYYQISLSANDTLNDRFGMAVQLNNIANVFVHKTQYDKALKYLYQSLQIAKELEDKEIITTNYYNIADCYKKLGDYKKAYENIELYLVLKDSLLNEESTKAITEMNTKYETEKKQKEIELLNKEKEKQVALSLAENKRKNTIIFSIVGGLILVILFSVFLFNRFRITNQQKIVIEEKNKEITDSITYAKRIQEAILPPELIIKNLLPNSFFLYKPKDIVSGDFYWLEQKDNKILFAAVDCTGHGVPGAFVSIVGHNGLNRAVNEFRLIEPAQILDKLNELVEETLRQKDNEVRDGMDISLCCIDYTTKKLDYSGSNNPLYLVRNGEILITKADKQPIGGVGENKKFTNHTFELQKGDTIYLFSDGFADQFGGPKGKKYGYSKFRELLLSVQDKEMTAQKEIIKKVFEEWKGELEQLDDVCVMSVRI